jgi:hypothetical protein
MVIVIDGKIGGGKTYFAVNWLLEKHYLFNDTILEHLPRGEITVISNIRDLRLPHIKLGELIPPELPDKERDEKLRELFNFDYTKEHKQVVFVVDEAQRYFHRKYYDRQVFSFFQMCRQGGVDIILITQDIGTMAKEVRVLAEYEVTAVPRTKRLKSLFQYNYRTDGEFFKKKNLKFKPDVASYYTSFTSEETEKITPAIYKYAGIAAVLLIGTVIAFKMALGVFFGGGKTIGEAQAKTPTKERVATKEKEGPGIPKGIMTGEELDREVERLRAEGGFTKPGGQARQDLAGQPVEVVQPEPVRRLVYREVKGVLQATYE